MNSCKYCEFYEYIHTNEIDIENKIIYGSKCDQCNKHSNRAVDCNNIFHYCRDCLKKFQSIICDHCNQIHLCKCLHKCSCCDKYLCTKNVGIGYHWYCKICKLPVCKLS